MSRREFPRKVRREALARAAGKCQKCGAAFKIGVGACEIDHILPSELGGEPTLANAMVLCIPCHAEKTADDVRRIRKGDRQRDKASGAIRPSSSLSNRNKPKADKQSRHPVLAPRQLFKEIRNV